MNMIKMITSVLTVAMVSGCASIGGANGPRGPKLVASGRSTDHEQYAEVGLQFSSTGDFVALVSPSRWRSPIATGGSLSWVNPAAWSDDAGRTGRILLGEAVIVGGVAVAAVAGGSGGGDTSGGTSTTPSGADAITSPPSGPTGGFTTPGE